MPAEEWPDNDDPARRRWFRILGIIAAYVIEEPALTQYRAPLLRLFFSQGTDCNRHLDHPCPRFSNSDQARFFGL